MKKKIVSQAALAAMASGVAVDAGVTTGVDDNTSEAEAVLETPAEGDTPQESQVVGEGETAKADAAGETAEVEAEDQAAAPVEDPQVGVLKAQLKEEREATRAAERAQYAAESRAESAEAATETLKADVGSLKDIAIASINGMQIALGNAKESFSDEASAASIVKRHAEVRKDFEAAFVVGGVSGANEEDATTAKQSRNSYEAAELRSVGI